MGSRWVNSEGGHTVPLLGPQRDEPGQSIRQFWEGPILRNFIQQCHAGSARHGCLGWIQHLARGFKATAAPGPSSQGQRLGGYQIPKLGGLGLTIVGERDLQGEETGAPVV